MLEKHEERRFVKLLKQKYNLPAIKFGDPSRRGAPDRLVLLPEGRAVFIEFKKEGALPRPEQLEYLDNLRALGFLCKVCYTAVGALAFCESQMILREHVNKGGENGTTNV